MDVKPKIGFNVGWGTYTLDQFGVSEDNPFYNYEIWVCHECQENHINHIGTGYNEDGSTYPDIDWDWESFARAIHNSLHRSKKPFDENANVQSGEDV